MTAFSPNPDPEEPTTVPPVESDTDVLAPDPLDAPSAASAPSDDVLPTGPETVDAVEATETSETSETTEPEIGRPSARISRSIARSGRSKRANRPKRR